ncbi:uncharacterized protein LOC144619217 [Crassostrea virginica]
MAHGNKTYPLGSPQVDVFVCQKHELPIDVTCEDCEEFICSTCVKKSHRKHNWRTISTATTLIKRGLIGSLENIEKTYIVQLDEEILRASQQIDENTKLCELEVSKLQNHYDAIVKKFEKIKKKHEDILKDSLVVKNTGVSKVRSKLKKRKKKILQRVKSLKETYNEMPDIVFMKTHNELTSLISTDDNDLEKSLFSMKYEIEDFNDAVLLSIMGHIDREQIIVTETNSFQWGNEQIEVLKAIDDDTCLMRNTIGSSYIEQVGKSGKKEKQFSVNINDVCIAVNDEMYVTDGENKSISRLSASGILSSIVSTDPLEPVGICQTIGGDLLVTLTDNESDPYKLRDGNRRLLRRVTVLGDVIREYEYQEDGQTRLFTAPRRVTQNGNTDICVINSTGKTTSELVIMSFYGSRKSVYQGCNEKQLDFYATDVVCDYKCNIIVNDLHKSTIHILDPRGKFMKYLLTEKEIYNPSSISLRNSTLWAANVYGQVKLFHYHIMKRCFIN